MIGVAVIEDHPLHRKALLHELGGMADVEAVADAGSVEEFETGTHRRPDVVILGLNLPGLHGADAVHHLCAAGLPVLVVSAAASPPYVLDAVARCRGLPHEGCRRDRDRRGCAGRRRGGVCTSPRSSPLTCSPRVPTPAVPRPP